MSFTDFLWNGSPPQNVTTSSSSTSTMPDWYQEYQKGVLAKANSIATQPFPLYPGPRVAGFSGDQMQAQQQVRDMQGQWQPWMNAAGALTDKAAQGFNQNDFNQWKSPYIDGVVNRIAELGNRNMTENLLPAVNSTFTGNGQFGFGGPQGGASSEHSRFTQQALRNTNESILGQQSLALQQAQDAAMGNYQGQLTRFGQMGNQFGNLAQTGQQLGLTGAAALDTSGQGQQALGQQNLNTAYQDFQNQQQWPQQNVNWMSQLLGNTAVPKTTNETNVGPASAYGPSGLSTLAGTYALLKGFG